MDPHEDARTTPSPASLLRWVARLAVVDLALLLIVDGFDAPWTDVARTALTIGLVVLVALFVIVGLLHLARRGRGD